LASTFNGSAMNLVGYEVSKLAANQVYKSANISPSDVDVVELHDCFSANELITYEALGLCPEGKAGEFIDRGDNTYGGKYVINPSGGLISKGHPLGATGIAQCVELCLHLRNLAGKRQVPNAQIGLQHNLGLGGACVVAAYRKPDWSISQKSTSLPALKGGSVTAEQFKCGVIFDAISEQVCDPKNKSMIDKVNASYKFKVSSNAGLKGIWLVNAKSGSEPFVKFMDDGKADCVLTAKDEDLFDIMSGKVDSMKAFLGGKLKLSGNPTLAMKLKQFQTKVKEALDKPVKPKKVEFKDPMVEVAKDVVFSSDKVFAEIKSRLETEPGLAKKLNANFRFVIKDKKKDQEKIWFVDCKASSPSVTFEDKSQTSSKQKADCTIEVSDEDFVKIIEGKLNSQTAFFNKQLKVSGNVMLATKLSQFQQKSKSKL